MIEIYYYSGSGYTLQAALRVRERLGGEVALRPMLAALESGELASRAQAVGLFFPMHAFGMPAPVKEFLRRARFPQAEYLFSLVTRGGAPSRLPLELDRVLRRQGKGLDAFAYATTVNTFDIVSRFPVPPEVLAERERFVQDIDGFAAVVASRRASIRRGYRNPLLERLVFPLFGALTRATGYFGLRKSFWADGSCSGCAACARLCPTGRIALSGGSPRWEASLPCHYCLACVHRCPQAAVQVKFSQSASLPRMPCPEVSNEDLARRTGF